MFATPHPQVKAWPSQPLDAAIKWLQGKPQDWVVADFGCGEARLAATVKQVCVCLCVCLLCVSRIVSVCVCDRQGLWVLLEHLLIVA